MIDKHNLSDLNIDMPLNPVMESIKGTRKLVVQDCDHVFDRLIFDIFVHEPIMDKWKDTYTINLNEEDHGILK